ncbi:MAG: SufE family protein [Chromatiaceae bacterium]|nr:SufE family protein [Chromatiaceae bacterium]MCF7995503.1 SufE family protein [Chromatiaceae bacterium]MCF8015806.1 SufE family protein [Chromatiaceae bacterium]
MNPNDVIDAFELLGDWDARYEFIGDLAHQLVPLTDEERREGNLVQGCNTRTWLTAGPQSADPTRIEYRADAETPLVRGLVALLLVPFQHQTPEQVLATDPSDYIARLGLAEHLSANRRAGMEHFIDRVYRLARVRQASL